MGCHLMYFLFDKTWDAHKDAQEWREI